MCALNHIGLRPTLSSIEPTLFNIQREILFIIFVEGGRMWNLACKIIWGIYIRRNFDDNDLILKKNSQNGMCLLLKLKKTAAKTPLLQYFAEI